MALRVPGRRLALLFLILSFSMLARAQTAVSCGQQVSGSFVAGQLKTYVLAASANDALTIRWLRTSSGSALLQMEFYDPTGRRIAASTGSQYDLKVTLTGNYTLIISDFYGLYTASYTLLWQRLNGPCSPLPLACGRNIATTLSVGTIDVYNYTTAGPEPITLRVIKTSGGSMLIRLEVYKPDGSHLLDTTYGAGDLTLPAAGGYVVMVSDFYGIYGGNYTLSLQRTLNPCGTVVPLGCGQSTSGSLGLAGQRDAYSLSALQGDVVTIRWNKTTGNALLSLMLFDPSGKRLTTTTAGRYDATLAANGTYLAMVEDFYGVNTAGYNMTWQTVNRVCAATANLTATPQILSFTGQQGGASPPAQTVQVTASDGSALTWSAAPSTTDGGNWLVVSQSSPTTPGNAGVSVNLTGLAAGIYRGAVTVQSATPPSTQVVSVTLTVQPAPAQIALDPPSFAFQVAAGSGNPPPQTLIIKNAGGGTLSWSAQGQTTSGGAWLPLSRTGTAPSFVSVSPNTANLAAGTYQGSISVTASGVTNSPRTASVTLTVTPSVAVQLSVGPVSLSFAGTAGAANPSSQTVLISNSAGSASSWEASSSGGNWLTVSPASGVTPAVAVAAVDLSGLAAGSYQGSIRVRSQASEQNLAVALTVAAAALPRLAAEPLALDFEIPEGRGSPPPASFRISNSGGGSLAWKLDITGSWLSASVASGTVTPGSPATVQAQVDVRNMTAGTYPGAFRLSSSTTGESITVPVVLRITTLSQSILASQSGLQFTAVEGGASTPSQEFGILNLGDGQMNWTMEKGTLAGGDWLQCSPGSGTSTANSVNVPLVQVIADATGLTAGHYSGFVRVVAPGALNSPQTVSVDLTVLPRGSTSPVEVRPNGLIFAAAAGSSVPLTRTVRLATATPGNVEARGVLGTFDGAAWLDAGPRSVVVAPAAAQTLTLQTTPGTLAAGVYRGAMTVLFSDATPAQVINVLFQVLPAGTTGVASQHLGSAATCVPQQLRMVGRVLDNSFQAVTGWPRTIEVEVRDDCGNNIPNATNSSPATVVASFSNGDSCLSLVHVGGGIYHSSWQPVHPQAQVTVKVRASGLQMQGAELTMQGRVDDNPTAPAIYPGGIVQSASYAKGAPLAPGGIVALFGRNLATGQSGSTSLPLPTTLAGASVSIAGQDAPLFYVHSGQLNVQIPSGLAPNSRVQAIVKVQGQLTVPESITLAPASPGVFTISSDGRGQGVIFLGDRLADGNSPARAGDVVVVYCTGLGTTQPPVAAGQASPGSPPATATAPVTATIGGRTATVQFAGLTPGLAGLYQVNVQVPEGVAAGSAAELVLTQNGIASNKVTLAIR